MCDQQRFIIIIRVVSPIAIMLDNVTQATTSRRSNIIPELSVLVARQKRISEVNENLARPG